MYSMLVFCIMYINPSLYKNIFFKLIKVILICIGTALIVLASIGYNGQTNTNSIFKTVTSSTELKSQLDIAKSKQKIALLKVDAKWCTYCRELDAKLFNNPQKQELLKSTNMYFIKLDVTTSTELHKYIEKNLDVVGLPEIIIIDTKGNIIHHLRNPKYTEIERVLNTI